MVLYKIPGEDRYVSRGGRFVLQREPRDDIKVQRHDPWHYRIAGQLIDYGFVRLTLAKTHDLELRG